MGVDGQEQRRPRREDNGYEIPLWFIRQVLVDRWVDRHHRAVSDQECVAVSGVRLQHLRCNNTVGTGAVIHHNRFAEALCKFLGQGPGDSIRQAARSIRNDESDGFRGPRVRARGGSRRGEDCGAKTEAELPWSEMLGALHLVSLLLGS
ncbi:hypothetical protein D3C81_1095530 [compost metagenome]